MFDFPNSPTVGDKFTPIAGLVYEWNGTGWVIEGDGSSGGGGGIPEAPTDGQLYGRMSASWSVVPSGSGGGIPEAPSDGMFYARQDAAWVDVNTAYVSFTYLDIVIDSLPDPGISDAPSDGTPYVRQDAGWLSASSGGGVEEAPEDGVVYARVDAGWLGISQYLMFVPLPPTDNKYYVLYNLDYVELPSEDWADITNKPSTFPPSTHSHPTSEVTGLDTALTGKAPTVHTHAQADVTNLVTDLAGKAPTVHTHSYASLTGIPSTFAPSAHVHATSDVTGLDTALAAKASIAYVDARTPKITVGTVAPGSPSVNDLWIDTN